MGFQIKWSFGVQVEGGPNANFSQIIDVEVYKRTELEIGVGGEATINIKHKNSEKLKLITITSSNYGSGVQYTVEDPTNATSNWFELIGPLIFSGNEENIFLSAIDLTDLSFRNNSGDKIEIKVLVGRDH